MSINPAEDFKTCVSKLPEEVQAHYHTVSEHLRRLKYPPPVPHIYKSSTHTDSGVDRREEEPQQLARIVGTRSTENAALGTTALAAHPWRNLTQYHLQLMMEGVGEGFEGSEFMLQLSDEERKEWEDHFLRTRETAAFQAKMEAKYLACEGEEADKK